MNQIWNDAAASIVKAGQYPIPVNDTLIELLQLLMNHGDAEFISAFEGPMNFEQISDTFDEKEDSLRDRLDRLMKEGVIMALPSSKGIMVYRLNPPLPGLFEFTLMRGESGEKQKRLAQLFDRLFDEMRDIVQDNYDNFLALFDKAPPLTQVVPVEADVDKKPDTVMPLDEVKKIVDKFDTIALVHCYCRHEKDLLDEPCKVTDERQNCFMFGKSAQFVLDHNFGKAITKEETLKIFEKAREEGLVHKSFHEAMDTTRDEFAICNCCSCCCQTFQLYYRGVGPMTTYTSTIAVIDEECTACGACEERCPMEAITVDDTAVISKDLCIGCGVCVAACPTEAIHLEHTGQRIINVPPKRKYRSA